MAADKADFIPLVDFGPFLTSNSVAEREKVAKEILSAFQTAGFVYLKNHGVPSDVVSRVFTHSAALFARPQAEKDAVKWISAWSNRGYNPQGKEKVSQGRDVESVTAIRAEQGEDIKETFEIGREDDSPNRFPQDEPGRKLGADAMLFWDLCKELHVQIMRALALGFEIDEHWFDSFTDRGDNTLRLAHYPRVKKSVFHKKRGQTRAGAHTDYGSVTILFQDDRGGLQIQKPNGDFVDATPIENTCVVNAGDLLSRWSNEVVRSTMHRVVEPPADLIVKNRNEEDEEVYLDRYSLVYFCAPNYDRWIEAIPNTVKEGEMPKFPGVNSFDYISSRIIASMAG